MNEWANYRQKYERAKERCEEIAKEFFPEDKYEVTYVEPVIDRVMKCRISFRRKKFEPNIDCEEYCAALYEWGEGGVDYNECVEDCRENVASVTTNTVLIGMETLSVFESTFVGECWPIWIAPDESFEEKEKQFKEFGEAFEKIGCGITEGWIHPHELVPGAGEYEEEYPACCFYHIKALRPGECRLPEVLELIEEKV